MRLFLILLVCVIYSAPANGKKTNKTASHQAKAKKKHHPHFRWSLHSNKTSVRVHAKKVKPDGFDPNNGAGGATPSADPTLQQVYHNGQLVNSFGVKNIMWNTAQHPATNYSDYYAAILSDPSWANWISQTYSVTGQVIATPGPFMVYDGTFAFNMTKKKLSDAAVQSQLNTMFKNKQLNASFYYNFYAIHISKDFGYTGYCTSWCAYHSFFTPAALKKQVYYAVFPDSSNCKSGCLYGNDQSDLSSTKMTISHEIAEFLTDPFWSGSVQGGWWDSSADENEICDYCGWYGYPNVPPLMNGLPINYMWSNATQGCVSPPNSTV